MRLDSITRIERYMVDALVTSPLVPLGVNVLRLADENDAEGIVNMVQSIAVRYVSSDINVINRNPMFLERRMTFELRISAQSYLSNSGHDAAIQMLSACYETLGNTVPPNTGVEVIEPFHILNERFEGLTDSTHYVYVQTWQLIAQDVYRTIAVDPCVLRGNCSYLWDSSVTEPLQPGDVLWGGVAYEPVLPPPTGVDYDAEYRGVINTKGKLTYKWSPATTFVDDYQAVKFVPTGTFDVSGQFLKVNVYDQKDELLFTYFAVDSGRKVLNVQLQMGPSPIGALGSPISGLETFKSQTIQRGGFLTVTENTLVYKDPTNEELGTTVVDSGALIHYVPGVELTVGEITYLQVGSIPTIGKGWVAKADTEVVPENQWMPLLDCDEPSIGDYKPEDSAENTGPIPSCE